MKSLFVATALVVFALYFETTNAYGKLLIVDFLVLVK